MDWLRENRRFRVALGLCYALTLVPAPLAAAEPNAVPPATEAVDSALASANDLIRNGDYDRAIEVLNAAITEARGDLSRLRESYLLLIKTYVYMGNDFRDRPQGRSQSKLNYEAARAKIAECLRIKELRHTRPEPASQYPVEMIQAFAEVRGQIFGSFRVTKLEPRDAMVILGGDTLSAVPPDSLVGDVDLALGPHLVVVRAPGYKDVTEEISISANSTLVRDYQLERGRSRTWYAIVAAGAVAVVGGTIALLAGGGSESTPPPEPLPGPPPPPGKK